METVHILQMSSKLVGIFRTQQGANRASRDWPEGRPTLRKQRDLVEQVPGEVWSWAVRNDRDADTKWLDYVAYRCQVMGEYSSLRGVLIVITGTVPGIIVADGECGKNSLDNGHIVGAYGSLDDALAWTLLWTVYDDPDPGEGDFSTAALVKMIGRRSAAVNTDFAFFRGQKETVRSNGKHVSIELAKKPRDGDFEWCVVTTYDGQVIARSSYFAHHRAESEIGS